MARISEPGASGHKTKKKRLPHVRASPPARSDVQSSGGDYGIRRATKYTQTHKTHSSDVRSSGKNYGIPKARKYLKEHPAAVVRNETVRDINTGKTHQVQITYHPLAHPHDQGAVIDHAIHYGLDTVANLYDRVRPHDGGSLGTVEGHAAGSNVASSIIEAGIRHPVAVTLNSAKSARDMAAAIPSGVIAAVHDPKGAARAFIADLKHRYGMTDAETQAYVTKHGFTSYALDAAGASSAIGASAGRAGLAVATRRAIAHGDEASYLTKARPALRTSGGKAVAQKLANRPLRLAGQRLLDSRRAARDLKLTERAAPEVDEGVTTAPRFAAVRANRQAGRTVEVTPRFDHLANKAQRMKVALTKARTVQLMKSEQHRKIDKYAREHLAHLTEHEKRAFYYAYTGLVPAGDPAGALRELSKREADITAAREAAGTGAVRKRVDELKTIDYLKAHAEKAFTPRLQDVVRKLREQDIKISREDPGLTPGQRLTRRYAQQAEHLGVERGKVDSPLGPIHTQESIPDFIRRVQEKADKRGLERPGYFPSEKYLTQDFASRAVGGTKATREDFRYTGKLFREGRQNTDPNVYLTGLARSVKRKHNWKLIADQFDAHTIPGLQHMSMAQLKSELAKHGIDPRSVEFWHPGRFRKALSAPDGRDGPVRNLEQPNVYGDAVTGGDEMNIERLQSAVHDAQTPPSPRSSEYVKDTGWSAVPKAAHNEIHSSLRTGGLAGVERASNTIFKAVPSRLLLGANPVWNAFQIASNAMISTGAAGVAWIPHLVRDIIPQKHLPQFMRQANLYAQLTPESRDIVDSLIGEGGGATGHVTKMGSTMTGSAANRFRALKASPKLDRKLIKGKHGPTLRDLNPIEAGFRFDRFQNAKFRRSLLFHSMKDYGKKLTPKKVEEILHNPAEAEIHAKFVNDWLGDYGTMTSIERHFNNFPTTPLFYGYLRHSLRLMFRTMPREAPIRLEILLKLGQLQHQELEKLGVAGLPWSAGKFYWTDHGQLKEFDLSRANPALNAVTSLDAPNRLIGLLPPQFSIAADLATHRNNFADRGWAVGGNPASPLAKSGDFTPGQYARIALNDALGLSNVYRLASKHTMFGPQGDDSLPWDQRPTHHKSPEGRARDRLWTLQDKQDSANWLGDLVPVPRDSRDQDIARAKAKAARKTKRKRPKSWSVGSGSGSSDWTTGSTRTPGPDVSGMFG